MRAEWIDLVFVDFHLHDGARGRSVLSDDNAVFPVSANEHCMVVIVDLPLIWICAVTLWVATGDARSFVSDDYVTLRLKPWLRFYSTVLVQYTA